MSQDSDDRGDSSQMAQVPQDAQEEASTEKPSRCLQWMRRYSLFRWLLRLARKWPRTFSLLFGVALPLFTLIFVSLFFGYVLSQMEAPAEIQDNNAVIANRALLASLIEFESNATVYLPQVCLVIYEENKTLGEELDSTLRTMLAQILQGESPQPVENATEILLENTTGLFEFMGNCGKEGQEVAVEIWKEIPLEVNPDYFADGVTFNWIRCESGNSSSSLTHQIWGKPFVNVSLLRPEAQEGVVVEKWREDQEEIFYSLLDTYENATLSDRINAYGQSLQYADGFENCYPDSFSSAWFWFIVMTTIGYGNQSPVTRAGQMMVYTFGFLSILLFGVVLTTAGTIVVTMTGDLMNRIKLKPRPWLGCIFWGVFYYAWMSVIAAYTKDWKETRLGEDLEFKDAYWFSYISTTTVGLGDYYLEPEVILRVDLFVFPIMFLCGFVLLSNFIVCLTQLLGLLVPTPRKSLSEVYADTNICCGPKSCRPTASKKPSDDTQKEDSSSSGKEKWDAETCARDATTMEPNETALVSLDGDVHRSTERGQANSTSDVVIGNTPENPA